MVSPIKRYSRGPGKRKPQCIFVFEDVVLICVFVFRCQLSKQDFQLDKEHLKIIKDVEAPLDFDCCD